MDNQSPHRAALNPQMARELSASCVILRAQQLAHAFEFASPEQDPVMTKVDLKALLADVDKHVAEELDCMPDVVQMGHELDVDQIPGRDGERVWHRLTEVIAVVADLKSSTQLGLNKLAPSTASIYEAATGNVASIFSQFDADFVDIQGDGGFALFWGQGRKRRALCTAITVQTFGEKSLTTRLSKKWDSLPETGLKVGVAHSPILVRRIGVEGSGSGPEPVWAGRAVNYAAKCAQQADKGQTIVTGTMWDWISGNDYLAATCGCPNGVVTTDLWSDVTIEKIPDVGKGRGEREGKLLKSSWCDEHGPEFCSAVLDGKRTRDNAKDLVQKALSLELSNPLRAEAKELRGDADRETKMEGHQRFIDKQRRDRHALQSGLRRVGQ